jgi:hypothetical protein
MTKRNKIAYHKAAMLNRNVQGGLMSSYLGLYFSMKTTTRPNRSFKYYFGIVPGSTMAKHSTHNPKIKGSKPATGIFIGREILVKKYSFYQFMLLTIGTKHKKIFRKSHLKTCYM